MNPFAWTLDVARAALTPPDAHQPCADCAHSRDMHHSAGTTLLARALVYVATGIKPVGADVFGTRCTRCVCKAFRPRLDG